MKLLNKYNNVSDSSSSSDSTDDDDSDIDNDSDCEDQEQRLEDEVTGNRIIDVEILSQNISTHLVCRYCSGSVYLCEIHRKGLKSQFAFMCTNKECDMQEAFPSYAGIQVGNLSVSSINRKANFAMRCIGGGLAELQTFCGIVNLPPPVQKSTHNRINKTVEQAAHAEQRECMKRAAAAEHELAKGEGGRGVRKIDVSVDGTYMTHGHTSNIGVSTVIGCRTGKVLDTGSLSKTCKGCDSLKKPDDARRNTEEYRQLVEDHESKCTLTHTGSSGSIEAEITKDMFSHSVELYNLQYARFIGDGDTYLLMPIAPSWA